MGTHRTLQVELIPDLSLTYKHISAMLSIQRKYLHTEIGPVQGLVRQPHFKPSTLIIYIEFCNCQTRPIHRNGVADVTISKNRCRVPDREGATSSVSYDGDDGSEVFNLDWTSVKVF
jgi:hypothetical protein